MSDNDNDADARSAEPHSADAHGHAALILVESLIHGLIVKTVLTSAESRDIVMAAADVQADYAAEAMAGDRRMTVSHRLLTRIANSLSIDTAGQTGSSATPTAVDVSSRTGPADDRPASSRHPHEREQ